MKRIKGFRTVAFNLIMLFAMAAAMFGGPEVAAIAALDGAAVNAFLDNLEGVLAAIWGFGNIGLRAVTSTAIFQAEPPAPPSAPRAKKRLKGEAAARSVAMLLFVGLVGLGLPACQATPQGMAETPQQRLAALEVEYAALFNLAADYEDLPRCSAVDSDVCSKQAVIDRLRQGHVATVKALDQAWTVARIWDDGDTSTADKAVQTAAQAVAAMALIVGELQDQGAL